MMHRILAGLLSIVWITITLQNTADCMPGAAKNIAPDCKITVSSNAGKAEKMIDGSHDTSWSAGRASGQYVQIELPDGAKPAGIYIMWNDVPRDWFLHESSGGSVWQAVSLGEAESFINTYVPVNSDTAKLRIESSSFKWKMSIAEIKVYGPGTLPDDIQVWQSAPEKADLMLLSAHPDDEFIYFGGALPYYAGQLKKSTVVVYMTSSPLIRKFEALDGLWKAGVREYPVFLPLANKYSSELKDAEEIWEGLDNVTGLVVNEIRRFRPDVVVTHDLGGEYGHGAHKLTALAVQKAVDASGNPGKYADSADTYGAWQVKKCYLHLYDENQVKMDWQTPLSVFGGRTALVMANEGYAMHVSQHFRERPILDAGEYDNSAYGLYSSTVGPDTAGGDFFENIPAAIPAIAPEVTATPLPTATLPARTPDTPVAEQSIAPMAAKGGYAGRADTVIAVVVMMLAAAGLLVIVDKKAVASAKHAKKADESSRVK